MAWKSDLLRSKINKCINNAIRGMLAENLSPSEMTAFLLFNDYGKGYLEIAELYAS